MDARAFSVLIWSALDNSNWCVVWERGQTAMSQKQFKAMQELGASIRDNRAKVEQKISANTPTALIERS